jgi:hypothetical protein
VTTAKPLVCGPRERLGRVAARSPRGGFVQRWRHRHLDRSGSAAVVEPERKGVRSCAKRRRASRSLERHDDHRRSGARACSEATQTETTEPSVAERPGRNLRHAWRPS